MQTRKMKTLVLAAAIAAAPMAYFPAAAATAAEVAPGMQVVDPNGGSVGTVQSVKGDLLILKTDRHQVQLPLTSFTAHEGKLMFGMTAAQLNAETEQALAAADAAVAVGAEVYGSDGTLAGQIEGLEEALVTIKLTSGEVVRLPRSGVAGSDKGARLGITADQLRQLASQAATTAEAPAAEEPAASQ